MKKNILIVIISIFLAKLSYSQFKINSFDDIGYNQPYNLYGNTGIILSSEYKNFEQEIGGDIIYFDVKENIINGMFAGIKYNSVIKSKKITLNARYLFKILSYELREDNYIITVNHKFNRFEITAGFNNRIYRYKTSLKKELIARNLSYQIYEPFNFMYLGKIFLKKEPEKWNFALAVSNFDDFIIEQEMNPMFYIEGVYVMNSNFELYGQFWFKKSGMAHAAANYFGYNFRFGLMWNFNFS